METRKKKKRRKKNWKSRSSLLSLNFASIPNKKKETKRTFSSRLEQEDEMKKETTQWDTLSVSPCVHILMTHWNKHWKCIVSVFSALLVWLMNFHLHCKLASSFHCRSFITTFFNNSLRVLIIVVGWFFLFEKFMKMQAAKETKDKHRVCLRSWVGELLYIILFFFS